MKPHLIILLILFTVSSVMAADNPASIKRYTATEIEAAILAGKVGPDIATIAKQTRENGGSLYVREITGQPIPYQLFTFNAGQGHTVMIEGPDKFVILCSAFGGGYANEFHLMTTTERTVLHYRYTSGSGRLFEHRATYVIGSGSPKQVGSRKDITPR